MKDLIGGLPDMLIFSILYGFLVIGIMITVKLFKRLDSTNQNAYNNLTILIALLFHAFNFYLIYDLMTVSPQSISGNGNPHIPYIFISFFLFLSFCIVLSKKLFNTFLKKNVLLRLLIMIMTLTIGCFSIVLQLDFVSTIKEELYYPMNNWANWWKDIHLNYLYFNLYTFLFGISSSGLIAGTLALIKKRY
ncbi:MAG: hypothetical protein ACQEXB_22695 [Bacillota bacterium]